MPARLKVFRTPIGFHDAYVAAPSQKAALRAWGSDANLFARGQAEQVTDPALTKTPLESPGTVIRVVRGTAAEHLAALPPARRKPAKTVRKDAEPEPRRRAQPKPRPKPRPSREPLDRAEAALAEAARRHAADQRDIAAREAAIAREKADLRTAQEREVEQFERARADAERRYRRAMSAWRGEE